MYSTCMYVCGQICENQFVHIMPYVYIYTYFRFYINCLKSLSIAEFLMKYVLHSYIYSKNYVNIIIMFTLKVKYRILNPKN